jgi:YHS domain-containing protein
MNRIFLAIMAVLFSLSISNAQATLRTKHFNLEKGIALQGYDAVSYFNNNKAVKGDKQFSASVEGITYYFSNVGNKELFLKSPKKYEPQYGGWCAYAMGSSGEKVEVDPETFKISNGKLYLFYHTWTNNTLNKWNKDEAGLKPMADKNWTIIFH